MATIRLVPSTYAVSNSTYITVTDAANMYTNVDSTTYASIRSTRTNTSNTYYAYIRGFNFGDVPDDAQVNSFTIKLRGYESYMSTSSSYRMSLYNNTTAISNTTVTSSFSTEPTTFTFPNGSLTWNTLKGYGNNFGIRIPLRRSSTSSNSYIYVYGAEIEVNYTLSRTITTTLSGNGTINPSGTQTYDEGAEYNLTIAPTNKSDEVTVTKNNIDVTDELEAHYTEGPLESTSAVPGSNVTTGFYRSNGAFYQSSSTSSDAWLRYAIGHSAESPYSTTNTSNTYVKDGTNDANSMGWMNYPFDFSGIPEHATVQSVQVKCYGAIESTSQSTRHADVELYSGNELKSTRQSFTSTQNGTITINDPGNWTREELQNAQLRFIVGYYGGRLLGVTWSVSYNLPGELDYYTYSYTVNENATIAVVIGSKKIYLKENNTWVQYLKVYKKVNGSWVEQDSSTWASLFDTTANYVKGN